MFNSDPNKLFWAKLIAVGTILLCVHLCVLPFVDGNTSVGIPKVSCGRQKNLIIGTSRTAQTMMPSEFEKIMDQPFFNFAFDAATTSYSDIYNQAIFEKMDTSKDSSIYILGVDPWSFTSFYHPNTGEKIHPEQETPFAELCFYNMQPLNVEYLLREYSEGWGSILLTKLRNNSTVTAHKDGWVEVTRNVDSTYVETRKAKKIKKKREEMRHAYISHERKQAFTTLISELVKHGQVFLVRLPIDPDYYELETEHYPQFESFIDSVQGQFNIPYFNMQSFHAEVKYNDGHHINKNFAPLISSRIATWIKEKK
jgi:hypothetical protein